MVACDDDGYQNCNPYPWEHNKLKEDKPRNLLGVVKGTYTIQIEIRPVLYREAATRVRMAKMPCGT